MVNRAEGTVIIIWGTQIFSCRPQDVAGWQLHLHKFDHPMPMSGLITRTLDTLNLGSSGSRWTVRDPKITFHDGIIGTVSPLTQLHSVTVETMNLTSKHLWSFSVLAFDVAAITIPWLGTSKALSAWALSAAIPHISLPALRQLTVCINHIDPAALGRFLMNHPTLEELGYRGETGVHNPPPHTQLLVDPPVAHPRLTTIRTRNRGMGGALAGLDTSPNLHTFSFLFPFSPPRTHLAGLVLDLRRISLRTNDTNVGDFWASTEEVRAVARDLVCVHTVEIGCWDLDLCVRVLPWLVLLSAVLVVNFSLSGRRGDLAKFLDEARSALPRVPQVTGHAV
ncbi:hypothetical protein B0H19DRAFT_1274075 [Mycena capillaripes]|nr:hypothetical protein B0H19DRAFT_1274075 [Mycena capillaripes]